MQDCNYCHHLSITEQEQNVMKARGLIVPLHICLKYNKQVIHRTSSKTHNEKLYPCQECINEVYHNEKNN